RPNCAPRGGRPRRCPAAGGLWRASTMRLNWLRGGVLLAAMGLAGCSSHAPEPPPVVQEEPGLPEKAEANLAGWLNLPRAERATPADDGKKPVARLQEKARPARQPVSLLPRLMPALTVPVFREARFSEKAGFSLPPSLADGARDDDLALHLARHGDAEA